jgi:hypothetical protein
LNKEGHFHNSTFDFLYQVGELDKKKNGENHCFLPEASKTAMLIAIIAAMSFSIKTATRKFNG